MENIWASSGLEVIGRLNLACNALGVWINPFNTEWSGQVIYLNNNEQIFIESPINLGNCGDLAILCRE